MRNFNLNDHGVEIVRNRLPQQAISDMSGLVNQVLISQRVIEKSITIQSVVKNKPHKLPIQIPDSIPDTPFIVNGLLSADLGFSELLLSSSIWEAASDRLGVSADQLVYHFANITTKPAYYGPEISWHRDYPNRYICPERSEFIRLLIPLDDMSNENGGLMFVPGSHLISDSEANLTKVCAANISAEETVFIQAKAGDVILLQPKTLHGSPPNVSPKARRLVVVQIGLQGCRYLSKPEEFLAYKTKKEIEDIISS